MQVKRKYHYFYKITNNINGHFYYGVHNTDNLDDGYMGSGKRLHFAYKKYGMENFTKEILKFFDSSAEAFEYEAEVVNETLVSDTNCYNIIKGGGFDTIGFKSVKDKHGNTFLCSTNYPRYLSGEFVPITKYQITVKDITNKCFNVYNNDPRYLSGEYMPIITGNIIVKDKNNNKFWVSKNDIRYLSGELVGHTKGYVPVKDKYGNYYQVKRDDPKYLSGELVHVWKGQKHTDETKERIRKTFKEIQHQKGEKNSQYGTCWIHNNKENKKIKKDELESYLFKGWIKGRKMKF